MKKIMTYLSKKITVLVLIVTIFSSCASRQEMAYFQDKFITPENQIENMNTYELKYKPDDMLTIDVHALDPDAVRPFNLPAVSYNSSSVLSAQGNLKMQTYLIDADGNIEFPVLGTVKLAGLTRKQATDYLEERISEYVKKPIVNIRLANFSISVLGEVNNPGVFTIPDERISISEAIALAGDLTIFGKRDNVLLIREVNGKKHYAKIDLTTINTVTNPTNYYLTQNDVIYVEPNNAKRNSSNYNPNTAVIISAISTLATIAAILIR